MRFTSYRRSIASILLLSVVTSCDKATAPRVPTTITPSVASITLDAIGASVSVAATVLDQDGKPMTSVAPVFSTTTPAVATVTSGATGTVTAVANGSGALSIVAGKVIASVPIIVAQAPVAPAKLAGDAQTAAVGTVLGVQVKVRVQDRLGNAMPGRSVTFAPSVGSGSVTPSSAISAADGTAVTTWTLGTVPGPQTLQVTTEAVSDATIFTATVNAGPPATVTAAAGGGQVAVAGSAVSISPAVRVADSFGNPVAGINVTFASAAGSGTITGSPATTNAQGIATAGAWTLGTIVGTKTVTATVAGLPPVPFSATAVPGAPAQLAIAIQPSGAVNAALFTAQPVVQVLDANGNLVTNATITVTASVASGTGTLGGNTVVTTVGGIATFTSLSLSGIAVSGPVTLSFSATGTAGIAAVTSASFQTFAVPPVNLTIDGLYVTQSTQTYARSVPLVAGRDGFLRVFVKASGANSLVPAVRVRLYQGGVLTQTYSIPAPAIVPTAITEQTLGSSWNLTLPGALIQPGLQLLADVDPTGAIIELSKTDNSYPLSGTPLTLDVRKVPTFSTMLVPVMQAGGPASDVTTANAGTYMDFAMRVYPLATYDAAVHQPFNFPQVLSSSYDSTWSNLLGQLYALWAAEGTGRNYYGVVHPQYTFGGTGLGYIGAPAAIGVDWSTAVGPGTTRRSSTAAHEWGHNFGRFHVDCGSPANPDPAYPYPGNSIGAYGYDIVQNVIRTLDYVDLMSYCSPLWISDYGYTAVLNSRGTLGGAIAGGAAERALLVWGHIGKDGVVLEPAFEINAPAKLPTRAGPYAISATDAAGNEVFAFTFDGEVVDHLPTERHFAFVVPVRAMASRPAAIRLTANGRVSLQRSAASPTPPRIAPASAFPGRVSTLTPARARLEWDARIYPMALVRDAATGQILSFARGGNVDFTTSKQDIEVTYSDGVQSVRSAVRIPR